MQRAKEYYEEYWAWRADKLNYHSRGITPPRHLVARRFIQETASENKANGPLRLLDVGCGEGVMGKLLREPAGQHRFHTLGVDLSARAVALAESYYDETRVLDAEAELVDLEPGTFDYIVCLEVVEHIFFPDRLIEAFRRLLAPAGHLIVSTPNFAFYQNRLTVMRGAFPEEVHVYSSAEHIHYFTFASFSQFLKEAGLSLTRYDGTFGLPRGWGRILGLDRARRLFLARPNLFGKQIVYLTQEPGGTGRPAGDH